MTPPPFQLKALSLTTLSLQIHPSAWKDLRHGLSERITQAPDFFRDLPVIVDLGSSQVAADSIDFRQLRQTLCALSLCPIGIRGECPSLLVAAVAAGWTLLPAPIPALAPLPRTPATPPTPAARDNPNITYTQSVRAGQQLCAPAGDLTVIGTVNPGAELLAAGHVHVYGALKGRVLAGIHGDTSAHIFCQKLEAELISIAGQYQILERDRLPTGPTQIALKDQRLQLTPLV